jgi:hypothetical protein
LGLLGGVAAAGPDAVDAFFEWKFAAAAAAAAAAAWGSNLMRLNAEAVVAAAAATFWTKILRLMSIKELERWGYGKVGKCVSGTDLWMMDCFGNSITPIRNRV